MSYYYSTISVIIFVSTFSSNITLIRFLDQLSKNFPSMNSKASSATCHKSSKENKPFFLFLGSEANIVGVTYGPHA